MFYNLKFQFTLFLYSLSYFTRIPVPSWVKFDSEQFYKGLAYLPLIGAIIALLMIMSFSLFNLIFTLQISLILTLIIAVFLTGALHEDGFADCCDGLGGGFTVEQRLKIMKDSQIGSYAGIGLILLTVLKIAALLKVTEFGLGYLFCAFFVAQILSRYCVLLVKESLPYARLQSGGKANCLAQRLTSGYLLFASIVSFLPFLLLPISHSLLLVVVVAVILFALRRRFKQKLGGYTGDCLGLVQQVIEVACYLLLGAII